MLKMLRTPELLAGRGRVLHGPVVEGREEKADADLGYGLLHHGGRARRC